MSDVPGTHPLIDLVLRYQEHGQVLKDHEYGIGAATTDNAFQRLALGTVIAEYVTDEQDADLRQALLLGVTEQEISHIFVQAAAGAKRAATARRELGDRRRPADATEFERIRNADASPLTTMVAQWLEHGRALHERPGMASSEDVFRRLLFGSLVPQYLAGNQGAEVRQARILGADWELIGLGLQLAPGAAKDLLRAWAGETFGRSSQEYRAVIRLIDGP